MCDGSGNNTNLVNQAAVSYMFSKGRSNPFQKDRWVWNTDTPLGMFLCILDVLWMILKLAFFFGPILFVNWWFWH